MTVNELIEHLQEVVKKCPNIGEAVITATGSQLTTYIKTDETDDDPFDSAIVETLSFESGNMHTIKVEILTKNWAKKLGFPARKVGRKNYFFRIF